MAWYKFWRGDKEEKLHPAQYLDSGKTEGTREFTQSYERMYEQLEVVNRGVNMIVDDTAEIKSTVSPQGAYRGVITGVKRGKVEELLNRTPNPFQDVSSFKRNLITDYLLDGNIFIYFDYFSIEHEVHILSAHRTPGKMFSYAREAKNKGCKVIIAGAGGAAHLPGMIASKTIIPVLGVPVKSKNLNGIDSLLSIVQMPPGVPVGTLAIGNAGAKNAALLAASIIATSNDEIAKNLKTWRKNQTQSVKEYPSDE